MKKVCVLGLGYVGLPTASLIAMNGFEVVGVDTNPDLLNILKHGDVHIEEPDLDAMVRAGIVSTNLSISDKPLSSDVYIIAVPTPVVANRADLSFVTEASRSIVPLLKKGDLVILEATSPPGTTDEVVKPILEESGLKVGKEIFLAYSPERIIPGNVFYELMQNDRTVGGVNPRSAKKAKEFYQAFVKADVYTTNAATAEMVKLMENTFRDVNISLANEFARIADKIGVDVWEAIELANKHPRVAVSKPGPGVGGHCIPVDPWFLIEKAPEEAKLITMARRLNEKMPKYVAGQVLDRLSKLQEPLIAVFGISYKADIDDVRESPAFKVIDELKRQGCRYRIYDPHVQHLSGLKEHLAADAEAALEGADCLLLLSDHSEFKDLPAEALDKMRQKLVFDTRMCFSLGAFEGAELLHLGGGNLNAETAGESSRPPTPRLA